MSLRPVTRVSASRPTIEGAGVHLNRVFGNQELPEFDPFLLFDDFGSSDPADYLAGFPWHPHRGIETVTYVLAGAIKHQDSLGNAGVIRSGDIQWMTAGSGIIHEEMPQPFVGRMRGFQLWVNLPANEKMTDPRYQELKGSQLPEVAGPDGLLVKIICGQYRGVRGPVEDLAVRPEYFDVRIPASATFEHEIPTDRNAFAYMIEGEAIFGQDGSSGTTIPAEHLAHFGDGESVRIVAGKKGARFLLVSGRPLREPISWYGPVVMNTQEELQTAFKEIEKGTFVKKRAK